MLAQKVFRATSVCKPWSFRRRIIIATAISPSTLIKEAHADDGVMFGRFDGLLDSLRISRERKVRSIPLSFVGCEPRCQAYHAWRKHLVVCGVRLVSHPIDRLPRSFVAKIQLVLHTLFGDHGQHVPATGTTRK